MLHGTIHQSSLYPKTSFSATMTMSRSTNTVTTTNNNTAPRQDIISIQPLARRPTLRRLDVFPFLLGYALCVIADCYNHHHNDDSSNNNNNMHHHHHAVSIAAVTIDTVYLALLSIQLMLFLKCQWDPKWKAYIAFHRGVMDSSSSSSNSSKIRQMKQWTHCLVMPCAQTTFETKETGAIVPVNIIEERIVNNGSAAAIIILLLRKLILLMVTVTT